MRNKRKKSMNWSTLNTFTGSSALREVREVSETETEAGILEEFYSVSCSQAYVQVHLSRDSATSAELEYHTSDIKFFIDMFTGQSASYSSSVGVLFFLCSYSWYQINKNHTVCFSNSCYAVVLRQDG